MNPTQHVIEHIQASYPCTLRSVINWCFEQGFEDHYCVAIASMLRDGSITLDSEDLEEGPTLIINPV